MAGVTEWRDRRPSARVRRHFLWLAGPSVVLLLCIAVLVALSSGGPAGGAARWRLQYSSPRQIARAGSQPSSITDSVAGILHAPGGPFIRDRYGRVVLLHGVNAVDKRAPYELYPSPGKPWNFSESDARRIASLGFNVVRLGILWQGLEPGRGSVNQSQTCAPSGSTHPVLLDQPDATRYLEHIGQTVDLLGRFHIYTILDMHQDVYNSVFRGEGAPNWAVCTDGQPIVPWGGRWSSNYRNPTLLRAENHFWLNDVSGDLQGQYDRSWSMVARYFREVPWILGYDPYNEPYAPRLTTSDDQHFAVNLECFYTGRAHPGTLDGDEAPVACPPNDPKYGVIPTILAADPRHLIFVEPDNFSVRHQLPSLIGRMDFPNLVYNFHAYCGDRSPVTGDPRDPSGCVDQIRRTIYLRAADLRGMGTTFQPAGPAWMMSEFGASQSVPLLDSIMAVTNASQLGWTYWSWKYYRDPTGSSHEALVRSNGELKHSASALDHPYAEATAGRLVVAAFDQAGLTFTLAYVPDHKISAPTIVTLSPASTYPHGYCAAVSGGSITSDPGDQHLAVEASPRSALVSVEVTNGACR